jgi:Penicillin binding protein transpeptidase domain/Penicillin-binding Protein dimerisation domain/NTF2-like N-terminal transpeptidase domain
VADGETPTWYATRAGRRRHRQWRAAGLVVVAVAVVGMAAVGVIVLTSGRHRVKPDATAAAYLTAWSKQDWPAMQALVDRPPANFTTVHQRMVADLRLVGAQYRPGVARVRGSAADVAYTGHLVVGGLGPWDATGVLQLREHGNRWQVEWSLATIDPALTPGGHFALDRTWPARAAILGAGGTPLTALAPRVSIGLQGSAVKNPGQLTAALVAAGAAPAAISAALTQARAHPDQFVPVFEVTDVRYQQIKPGIYSIPGTRFVRSTVRATATPDLAAHVVGVVGQVTADQLKSLGQPYQVGDVVGQSGIEAAAERQLAGSPDGVVRIVDAQGKPVKTVMTFAGKHGTPVQTTLDLHTQQAAEAALNGVPHPAAVVALRASSGEILAVVSRPTVMPFDRALDGHYPPGSTFKVVTSAALLAGGLTPDSQATCPPTIAVGGRTFHNFEGETQAALPLHRAFAISCNTAFIGLSSRLSAQALVTAAAQFGFGTDPQIGLSAFGGRVPLPADQVEKVATSIGQARVEASPLMMATVAAAVDAGTVHPPQLVAGAADDRATSRPLDPTVVAGLRSMMAEVVTSGTGTPAAVPGQQVYGKTGTAEFGTAKPPTTHAWFIGFRGVVAFALLVEDGGIGGQVAAPLAAKFVRAL